MSERSHLVILNPTCLDVLEAHRDYLDACGVRWTADPAVRSLRPDQVDEVLTGAAALILPASPEASPKAARSPPWPRPT